MLSCTLIFPKVPPDPLPPPILYEYKIANLPELLISYLNLKYIPWRPPIFFFRFSLRMYCIDMFVFYGCSSYGFTIHPIFHQD